MNITEYKGKSLLDNAAVEDINKQADLILQEKDVSMAWSASMHLKKEISGLDQNAIKPVLNQYRAITTRMKALALPLLEKSEIENLLRNNLEFLDTQTEQLVAQGLIAYIASQPDDQQEIIVRELSKAVDKNSMFGPKILEVLDAKGETFPKGLTFGNTFADNDDPKTDQAELAQAAKKASQIQGQISVDQESETIARSIFSQSGTKQSEQDFARRAKALVKSRLRDIRTKIQIKEYLSRSFEVGGLGLSENAIDPAQKLIENAYNRAHTISKKGETFSKDSQKGKTFSKGLTFDAKTNPQKEIDNLIKSSSEKGFDLEDILKSKSSNKASAALSLPISAAGSLSRSSAQATSPLGANLPPSANPQQYPPRRQSAQSNKIRLDDIKARSSTPATSPLGANLPLLPQSAKPVGLSGEFSSFDISDFRSFGNSSQATEKILSKIKSLEIDSMAQKYAAIRNFHSSPLYQKYISIGETSLTQGKKLSQALLDPNTNPDKITQEEFFAISDLNGKLK